MTDPPAPARRLASPLSLIVLVVGLALLVLSVRQVGWVSIAESFRSVGAWLAAVVALGLARMAMRARTWTLCSRAEHAEGIPMRSALGAVLAADALGNLTPLGLLASEPAKVMLGRRHVPTRASVSSVAVENGFYTLSVLVVLLGGVWVLLQRADVPPAMARAGNVVLLLAGVAAIAVLWAFRARPALLSRLGHLAARLARRPTSAEALRAFEASVYDVVRWPLGRLGHVMVWEALFHVAAVLEVWLILRLLPGGQAATLTDAFLMETTGRFITVAFKFIPYRLGVDEVGSGSVSQLLGLGASTGVALALVRRVRILILNAAGVALLARASRPVA